MTEQLRESLSALMDDEANELELERLLARAGEDDELRATWVRYNIGRAAAGGTAQAFTTLDISRRVSAAIKQEQAESAGENQTLRRRLMRPLASMAVAASVAATAVIGGQQLAQLGSPQPFEGESSVAASASPVSMLNIQGAVPVQASYGTQYIPVLQPATRTAYQELARQRMARYQQEHAEHAALNSPQGLVPFARVSDIHE